MTLVSVIVAIKKWRNHPLFHCTNYRGIVKKLIDIEIVIQIATIVSCSSILYCYIIISVSNAKVVRYL